MSTTPNRMSRFSKSISSRFSTSDLEYRSFDSIDATVVALVNSARETVANNPQLAKEYLEECLSIILVKDESSTMVLSSFIKKTPPTDILLCNCEIKHVVLILFMYGYLLVGDEKISHLVDHLDLLAPNQPNTHLLKGLNYFEQSEFEMALSSFTNMVELDNDNSLVITKDLHEKISVCKRTHDEVANKYQCIQLRCGIDIATKSTWYRPVLSLINTYATQLCNLVYILVDLTNFSCLVVDPCWDVNSILYLIKINKWNLTGIVLTHHHFDHVGGIPPSPFDKFYVKVPGVSTILERYPDLPLYVHELEVDLLLKQPGNSSFASNVKPVQDMSILTVGPNLEIKVIHTPGHTAGSMCLLINNTRLLTGDTLFVNSCGRTDFPESDVTDMCLSLRRLSELNEHIIVLPAHRYGGRQSTIKKEKDEGILKYASNESLLFSMLTKTSH
eukprot:NODE_594_length_6300_cov_0.153201.p1 type:complete len:445 gc:universal NODE_594_length_6300_cov_0.153201:1719-385(-)